MPLASVVIPAHDEAASIARTLTSLRSGVEGDALEVVVVCNGCTDDTAELARAADPQAVVLEIDTASKREAVRTGNAAARTFPRIHLDGDVELDGASAMALVAALAQGDPQSPLAVAPTRLIPRGGVSPWVRWYYDVWEQLPAVREGLFGRGVYAVNRHGQAALSAGAHALNDDLVASETFSSAQRRIVEEATAVVRPPRTLRDLVRRRTRVATGNAQADMAGLRGDSARTGAGDLALLARGSLATALKMPVFAAVHVASAFAARRAVREGDFTTWLREESSRGPRTAAGGTGAFVEENR